MEKEVADLLPTFFHKKLIQNSLWSAGFGVDLRIVKHQDYITHI
jgi:hypothetical protein